MQTAIMPLVAEPERKAAIRPETPGIHHVALRTSDLQRARRFYGDVLGLPVLLEFQNLFIVAAGNTAIAIRGPESSTPPDDKFNPYRVGLDHIALACSDATELARVTDALTQAGIENTGIKFDEALGKQYVAFKDPDRIAWEFYLVPRNDDPRVIAVEKYLTGLKKKDLSGVPFSNGVTFEGPLSPHVTGSRLVIEFLQGMFPVIRDIRVRRHIVEGDRIATLFDLETTFGTVPVFDSFHIVNGEISEIRPFYDPRPIIGSSIS